MIIIAKILNIPHMGLLSNALNKAGICQETPYGNCIAPCLDSRYDAILFIGLMLLSADPDTTTFPVKQESGFMAEDDMLPMTFSPAEIVSSPIHMRLSTSLQ